MKIVNYKFFIHTHGCQMNMADSARLTEYLIQKSLKPVKNFLQADFILINLCAVRQSAVDKAWHWLENAHYNNKQAKIILIGCILKTDQSKFGQYADLIISSKSTLKNGRFTPSLIWQKIKKAGILQEKKIKKQACLSLLTEKNKSTAYLPIMRGCNNFCSYCVVPYTRGAEKSRLVNSIISEFKKLVKKGFKEIILLGQNVNSYHSKKVNFIQLLKILNSIPGNFKISFLTNHPKDMSDELIQVIAENKKIKKYIHLPLQAGSDKILKKMNRQYSRTDYLKLIKKIRKAIPNCRITTDIIVGFPGETKKDFQASLNVVKQCYFKQIYIGKYSPRPGTAAYKLKDNVSWEEKKTREDILRKFLTKKKTM